MTIDKNILLQSIRENHDKLQVHGSLDGYRILIALAQCESNFGVIRRPRFEKGYAPGGRTYIRSTDLQRNYTKWGAWASCSYSSFQIMNQTAWEMGFRGSPTELWIPDDSIALVWVIHNLNRRILSKANTPEEVADAYNSGTFEDSIIPQDYIDKFVHHYRIGERGIV